MIRKRIPLISWLLMLLCCTASFCLVAALWKQSYSCAVMKELSGFCRQAAADNPELEAPLLASLKTYLANPERAVAGDYLKAYGYAAEDFFSNGGRCVLWGLALALAGIFVVFTGIFLFFQHRIRYSASQLTAYLEQVNAGKPGTLIRLQEDAFSHLRDELYKTVTWASATREAAVQAKNQFADNLANIAHQLKTPVTAALLSLQLMEERTPNPYIQPVRFQLERLTVLEDALLTLSRIDAGMLPMTAGPVDLFTALTLAAEQLECLAEERGVSILVPEKPCVAFLGDMEWTIEALINLMKNCLEHSPAGGIVHCDYARTSLYAQVLIWDEGPGFAPEELPHLFERFYRGKHPAGQGIGIGLSLARSIFAMENGTVTAANRPEGGACFEVHIYFQT